MAPAFEYKPRIKDIRIKPPKDDEAAANDRACDWAECRAPASCRAPKGPLQLHEHYLFCPAHAAQYNKSWDFFADMNEDDLAAFQKAAETGHRPTWDTRTANNLRDVGQKAKRGWAHAFSDPFNLFGDPRRGGGEAATPAARRVGKLEARSYETLDLAAEAAPDAVRARYAELVKRLHPDANQGDRSSEEQFQRVVRAYKTLKKAGRA